jgi:hypothetical protein
MALHFVVNDHGLREQHKEAYLRTGRWMLAAAVLIGWVVALLTEISEVAIAMLTAFLAGGVVMNVLKEELPEERESRFWAFALGAAFTPRYCWRCEDVLSVRTVFILLTSVGFRDIPE